MRAYNRECAFCRLMRSFAFTGVGMALGGGGAYLVGASRTDMLLSGIFVATIIVFGLAGKKKKK